MAPEIFADKSQALKKGRMVKQRLLFGKISFFLGGGEGSFRCWQLGRQ